MRRSILRGIAKQAAADRGQPIDLNGLIKDFRRRDLGKIILQRSRGGVDPGVQVDAPILQVEFFQTAFAPAVIAFVEQVCQPQQLAVDALVTRIDITQGVIGFKLRFRGWLRAPVLNS